MQAVGSLPAVALLERVARAVPLPPSPELVVIADYGSSEGHNSLVPMLSIEDFELFHGEDRIWTQFEASGDAHAFGAQWAAFCRASVFPTLAASLDGAPDSARSVKFFDELETDVAARLAAAPVRMTIPLAQMMLVKADSSARRSAR